MRNIGASIGISMMSYLLVRNSATAHSTLVEAIAFIDNFKLMMFVSFLAIPLVILVQRPRRPLGNQGPALD